MAAFQLIFLCPSLANFPLSRLLRCMSLITLHLCPLLAEPLKWAELERPKPLITLESAMELVYCLHFSPYKFVWCSILYVYRYAWAVINVFKKIITIVLHCGLWSGLKCEADSLPLSKSRGRGSVHINIPRPLYNVEQNGSGDFPEGKCLGKFASACLKVE